MTINSYEVHFYFFSAFAMGYEPSHIFAEFSAYNYFLCVMALYNFFDS